MVQKKLIRHQLASYAQAIRPLAQPLLKDWLLTSRQGRNFVVYSLRISLTKFNR
jgi:hypothetical protein